MYVAHCKLHWPSAHARGSQLGWHQDSRGVHHQFTPFSAKKTFATREVCFGSFCIKRWPFSYSGHWRVGRSATCRILMYIAASIIQSKMQISVVPCHPIPAHTCTLMGCLAWGFGWGGSPFFLQQNLLWHSSCTDDSSVHKTSSKLSGRWARAHSRRFSLFAWRISWQYADPRYVQPSSHRAHKIVLSDSLWLRSSNCTAVASSSAALCLQLSEEGQQCTESAFLILVASQCCRSRHSVCGNVAPSVL